MIAGFHGIHALARKSKAVNGPVSHWQFKVYAAPAEVHTAGSRKCVSSRMGSLCPLRVSAPVLRVRCAQLATDFASLCFSGRTSVVLRHKTLVFESGVIESRPSETESLRTPRDNDDFAESTADNGDFFDDSVIQNAVDDLHEDVLPVPVRRFALSWVHRVAHSELYYHHRMELVCFFCR